MGPPEKTLAAKAAQLAENLANGAAIEVTHLIDLLICICLAKTGLIVTDLLPIFNQFVTISGM